MQDSLSRGIGVDPASMPRKINPVENLLVIHQSRRLNEHSVAGDKKRAKEVSSASLQQSPDFKSLKGSNGQDSLVLATEPW